MLKIVAAIEMFISGQMDVITVIVAFSWKGQLWLNCNDVSLNMHQGMEIWRVVIVILIKSHVFWEIRETFGWNVKGLFLGYFYHMKR